MQHLQSIRDSLSNKFVRIFLVASMLLGIGFYGGRVSRNGDMEGARQDGYASGYQQGRNDTYEGALSGLSGTGGGDVDNGFSLTPTPVIPNPIATPQIYVLNRGDTIWGIADYLIKNDPRYSGWTTARLKGDIIRLNPNIEPERMHRGNVLYLP